MANPFDQFDNASAPATVAAANPFDQFDAAPPPSAPAVTRSSPVQHTGYRAQVARTMSGNGPAPVSGPVPSWSQIGSGYADLAKGAAIGVPSGMIGTPGDMEHLGRAGLRFLGADVSPDTVLPTTQDNFVTRWAGPPVSEAEAAGRAGGAFIGSSLDGWLAGKAIGGVSDALSEPPPPLSQIKVAAKNARDAGFVLPPNLVKDAGGTVTDIASAAAGKARTAQFASSQNQELVNAMAAEDLGLPEGAQITDAAINDVKSQAGKSYQAVVNSIPWYMKLKFDPDFIDQINALGDTTSAAGQEFPAIVSNDKIDALKSGLLQDVAPDGTVTPKTALSPAAGVDLVKKLRSQATANFKAIGDPERHALALAQRDAADAVDSLMERRLTQLGKPDVVAQYQDARQLMAKAYDVEAAANTESGNVSARGLARLLQSGRPMTGKLQSIAQSASAFPKAFQNPATFGGVQNWDALDFFGTLASGLKGRPDIAGAIMARPLIRGALLSPGVQDSLFAPQGVTPSGIPMSVLTGPAVRAVSPPALPPPSPTLGMTPTPPQRVVSY